MANEWMNNPKLKNIDPKKLNLLIQLAEQAEKKEADKLLPFFIAVTQKADAMGISFSDDETDVILNVLKTKMSPDDINKIEMIKNLTSIISSKAQN